LQSCSNSSQLFPSIFWSTLSCS